MNVKIWHAAEARLQQLQQLNPGELVDVERLLSGYTPGDPVRLAYTYNVPATRPIPDIFDVAD